MPKETIGGTVSVAMGVCIVCSVLVSSAAVFLQPLQKRNKELYRKKNVLIAAGLLSEEELEDALKLQAAKGRKLGEILLDLGVISEEEMLPFIQRQLSLPSVKLREGVIDPAVVRILPRVYEKGKQATVDSVEDLRIRFDPLLPHWNYIIWRNRSLGSCLIRDPKVAQCAH